MSVRSCYPGHSGSMKQGWWGCEGLSGLCKSSVRLPDSTDCSVTQPQGSTFHPESQSAKKERFYLLNILLGGGQGSQPDTKIQEISIFRSEQFKKLNFPKKWENRKKNPKNCEKLISECVILLFFGQFPFSFSKYFEEKQLVLND